MAFPCACIYACFVFATHLWTRLKLKFIIRPFFVSGLSCSSFYFFFSLFCISCFFYLYFFYFYLSNFCVVQVLIVDRNDASALTFSFSPIHCDNGFEKITVFGMQPPCWCCYSSTVWYVAQEVKLHSVEVHSTSYIIPFHFKALMLSLLNHYHV